jgi:signal transduction histidine kinase
MLLTVGTVIAWTVYLSYETNRSQAVLRAVGMTKLLAAFTQRNMEGIELVLKAILDQSPMRLPQDDAGLRAWMQDKVSDIPDIRAIYVIGADGFIRHDTDYPETPRVSLADRDYFQYHQQSESHALHVSQPLISRSLNRWFLAVSRRIDAPGGQFAGIVVAAVEPAFYERIYRELELGPADSIALWHDDGHLIARYPDDMGLTGQRMPHLQIFQNNLPENEPGTYIARNEMLGWTARAVGYQRLPDSPLIVTTALGVDDTISSLRRLQYGIFAIFLLLCAMTVGLFILLFRRLRERQESLRRDMILQKSQALGQMTSGVAHDFNNMIAAAESGIRMVVRHIGDAERAQEFASAASEALRRGAGLVQQLLQFAKQNDLAVEQADVNHLLRKLEPLLRQSASGVEISFDLHDDLPTCWLDETQFDSAILNLVINARDAMDKGKRGSVTISTREHVQSRRGQRLRRRTYVEVDVADNGPGIPAEIQQKVFEPFFSTKGERGTGLGLAQVRGFLEQIGGTVTLSSEVGTGTRIRLFFPCDRDTR